MTNYIPMNSYVIVKKMESSQTTSSGIILKTSTGPDICEVLAIAPDVEGFTVGSKMICHWKEAMKFEADVYAIKADDFICKVL
jgi:co-chaperonin GroES (HSP10)